MYYHTAADSSLGKEDMVSKVPIYNTALPIDA